MNMTSIVAIYESASETTHQRLFHLLTGIHAQNFPEGATNDYMIWKSMAVNPNTKLWIWDYYYFDENHKPQLVSGKEIGTQVSMDTMTEEDSNFIKQLVRDYIWRKW